MQGLKVPEATIKRLSIYMRVLRDLEKKGVEVISSAELADICGVNAAQIRKDLTYFGEFGVRGVGYYVKELHFDIRKVLGLNQKRNVALIGVGNLGRALASYRSFAEHGYVFVAAFDVDPQKVGTFLPSGIAIEHLDELPRVAREKRIEIAIITTPAEAAQEAVDAAVRAGIRGILNFAPVQVSVPDHVKLKRVDLTTEFDNLVYHLSSGA
ncbi:MAG: redox-sensing transcriptional repressor Rex [Candidatus Dadabacteria bacterium]|nr:MAG: redox-sensing transcriptional repressor Rex [Candidatus Dadabacteria bacterium]